MQLVPRCTLSSDPHNSEMINHLRNAIGKRSKESKSWVFAFSTKLKHLWQNVPWQPAETRPEHAARVVDGHNNLKNQVATSQQGTPRIPKGPKACEFKQGSIFCKVTRSFNHCLSMSLPSIYCIPIFVASEVLPLISMDENAERCWKTPCLILPLGRLCAAKPYLVSPIVGSYERNHLSWRLDISSNPMFSYILHIHSRSRIFPPCHPLIYVNRGWSLCLSANLEASGSNTRRIEILFPVLKYPWRRPAIEKVYSTGWGN